MKKFECSISIEDLRKVCRYDSYCDDVARVLWNGVLKDYGEFMGRDVLDCIYKHYMDCFSSELEVCNVKKKKDIKKSKS